MITERPVFLYRMFDRSNVLLYVGISQSFFNRVDQHAAEKDWFCDVWCITAERFDGREKALMHEKQAIQQEKPLYNKIHNTHQATDALAPVRHNVLERDFLIGKLVTQYDPWHGLEVAGLGFQGAIDHRVDEDYYAVTMLSYLDGCDMYVKLVPKEVLATFAIYNSTDDLVLYKKKHEAWQERRVDDLIRQVLKLVDVNTFSLRSLQEAIAERLDTTVALSLIETSVATMISSGRVCSLKGSQGIYTLVDRTTA